MTRHLFALSVSFLLVSFAASATSPEPKALLTHTYDMGMVPPQVHHAATCYIYEKEISIQRNYAGVVSWERRPLSIDLTALRAQIAKAAQGKVVSKDAPTDGPYDAYHAYDEGGKAIVLKLRISGSTQDNEAREARSLVTLLDAHCPDIRR